MLPSPYYVRESTFSSTVFNYFSSYPLPWLALPYSLLNPTAGLEQPQNPRHCLTRSQLDQSLCYSPVVSLMSIVTCPGCNRAFTAGGSMCVHLFHSPQCRAKNVSSTTNLPFWLVPDELPFHLPPLTDGNEQDSVSPSDSSFPIGDGDDDEMLDESPPLQPIFLSGRFQMSFPFIFHL